ncbi:MAG TPA: DUF4124 domain-containing protein, partial [Chromatiales bacterium]|nr:DUF4124 domain-containing protein [Chromatiales bacterium]
MLWIAGLPATALSDAYKWVDDEGVHYSDRGRPGAEVIHLPKDVSHPSTHAATPPREKEEPAGSPETPVEGYTLFAITQPAQDGTVRSNVGKVQVVLSLEPDLAPDHRFRFYLDGKALEGEFSTAVVEFTNVERGEHSLRVEIVDIEKGRVIAPRSTRFWLRRAA